VDRRASGFPSMTLTKKLRIAMRLRVVTLNVWNTEGDTRRSELINHELKRLNSDLVAFQEVVQTLRTS
jgi:hypothetical protein